MELTRPIVGDADYDFLRLFVIQEEQRIKLFDELSSYLSEELVEAYLDLKRESMLFCRIMNDKIRESANKDLNNGKVSPKKAFQSKDKIAKKHQRTQTRKARLKKQKGKNV